MNNFLSYGIIYSAFLFGRGSLIAFLLFLFMGSLNILNFELSELEIIWMDAGLSLLFFIQHSGMVRKSFQQRVVKFIPTEYYNAIYAIVSGIVLILLILLWQKSSWSIGTVSGIYRWLFRLIFFLSIAGFIWGVRALDFFDPFGTKKIFYHIYNKSPQPISFVVKGPYQVVRHPLYFFMMIMIWASPDLTIDRLLFNVLWTIWIIIGTVLEEHDLIDVFGDEYREYQKRVSMFVPLRFYKNYRENLK